MNLVRGREYLAEDVGRAVTGAAPAADSAFTLGETMAATPGEGDRDGNGDGNGNIDNLNHKIAVWDSTNFNKAFVHGTGLNVGTYSGSVAWYDDDKGHFDIDVWSGGLNHYARAQALFNALDR